MSESNWSEGYVINVPYTYGFYSHLSPINIELCLFQNGYRSPNWREEFTYCELACGHGLTSIVLACLYPKGKFYAMDFNPIHIGFIDKIVKSIGLSNIYYSDASFAEYLKDESLPMFDYISFHGIYSWISEENRRNIQEIINKRLKLGGVVSVSYNVLPGWSAFSPLQYFMNYYQTRESSGHILKRIDETLQQLEKMHKNHSLYLINENVKFRLDSIKDSNKFYLAHEYCNKDWHPMYSVQVIEEMERAKLNYICSADILSNIPSCNFTASVYEHIMSMSDVKTRELMRDFYLNSQFRRDIFIKGGYSLSKREQRDWLDNLTVVLNISKEKIEWEHRYGMVIIKLPVHFYEPVLESIDNVPTKLSIVFEKANKIIKERGLKKHQVNLQENIPEDIQENGEQLISFPLFWEIIFTLLGIKYIEFYDNSKENLYNLYSVNKFNNFMLNSVSNAGNFCGGNFSFISPYNHSLIYTSYLETLFLYWEFKESGRSLRDTVIEMMKENNFSLVDDNGNILTSEEAQTELLNSKYELFCKTKKLYMQMHGYLDFILESNSFLKNIQEDVQNKVVLSENTHTNNEITEYDIKYDKNEKIENEKIENEKSDKKLNRQNLTHPKSFGLHSNKPSKKR